MIFELRSCPLSMQSYILQQQIRRIIEKEQEDDKGNYRGEGG